MRLAGLAARMWLWAAALRVVKHVVPLPVLVRAVARRSRISVKDSTLRPLLAAYLASKRRFPFRPPGNCLERSLVVYRWLAEAGEEPELVVGVRRSPRGVEGHVWVTVDGTPLGEEPEDLAGFAQIVTFDASGRQRTVAGFDGTLSAIRVR